MRNGFSDGEHRIGVLLPDRYIEYSQTTSGGTIYVNPSAPAHKRWRIDHASFGQKFFAEHDEILKWTVEQMRERYDALK